MNIDKGEGGAEVATKERASKRRGVSMVGIRMIDEVLELVVFHSLHH